MTKTKTKNNDEKAIQKAFLVITNLNQKTQMLHEDLNNDEFFKQFYTTNEIKNITTARLYKDTMKLLLETKAVHTVKHKRKTYVLLNFCQNYFSHNYEKTEKAIREYEKVGMRKLKPLKIRVTELKNSRV